MLILSLLLASPIHAIHLVHAVHISYTQATWTQSVISGKATYYKDDYTKAASAWTGKQLENLPEEEAAKWRKTYFANFFRAWAGSFSKQIPIEIQSVDDDGSSYIFHFAFHLPEDAKTVMLDNRIIQQEYRDQTNLLQITIAGRDENYAFTKSDPTLKLTR